MTDLATFRSFFWDASGAMVPVYYYDPFETDPLFSWDETGEATDGRYIVRIDGDWQQTIDMVLGNFPLTLIEIA